MVSNWKYMWLLLSSILTAIWFCYRMAGCHILCCSHSVKYLCHSSCLLQDKETDYLHLCLGIIHIFSVLLFLNLSGPHQQANSSLNCINFAICIFWRHSEQDVCVGSMDWWAALQTSFINKAIRWAERMGRSSRAACCGGFSFSNPHMPVHVSVRPS